MAELFANNASTTLNGSITNSATSVVVSDASVFPSSGNFRILIGTEIITVTSVSGNTLTVTRGAEGTTAVSHNSGDNVDHVYTKGSIEQLIQDYDQVGGYASRPSSNLRQGQVYTANDMNARWMYDGSNWNLIWPTFVPYSRRYISANWSLLNQSTATFTDQNGVLVCTTMPTSNNALRGIAKSIPTAPYKVTAIIGANNFASSSYGWYLGHRESSTGKMCMMYNVANSGGTSGVEFWNNFNSFSSSQAGPFTNHAGRPRFPRIENDGTNWNYYVGYDGKNWSKVFSHAKNSNMTTAADQIFIGAFCALSYSSVASSTEVPPLFLLGYWEE